MLLYIYSYTIAEEQEGLYVMWGTWKIYDGANKHPTTIKWNHTFWLHFLGESRESRELEKKDESNVKTGYWSHFICFIYIVKYRATRPLTFLITSSCTRLKLIQIMAMPNNKYKEHKAIRISPSVFFWSGTKSPKPIVVRVTKQK